MYARKLNKSSSHRLSLLRTMITFLMSHGRIITTFAKAKEVGVAAEKLITKAKIDNLHRRRQIWAYLTNKFIAKKLFDEIAPKYSNRNGGYTRVLKIGQRRGDAAEMAVLELI
ncbi:MAG: 50S ribosomal protein L17 [Candidatus Improbicoccus devescovinae]|nr:MAG: 50S ribosomal protein L17 [Candidatus Improbicoccus devescovinae]